MSRKTSIPPKRIAKGFGFQTYRSCDEGFADSMRLTTFNQADNEALVRESEFAKPYDPELEDYSAMEYQAPYYPPFGWDNDYMGDLPEFYDPWHITFFCDVDPCWCEDQTYGFVAVCSYEIVDVKFDPPAPKFSVKFNKSYIAITAKEGASGTPKLTITMRAPTPKGGGLWQGKYRLVLGTHSGISADECDEDECEECDDTEVAWDYGSSASTIAQSGSVSVYIIDPPETGGPYSWSVSPPCFNLDDAITVGLENTLNADADACGPAEITVTGCDGTIVTGEVRCTSGEWVKKLPFQCPSPGTFSNDIGSDRFDRIEGKYKVVMWFQICEITSARGCDQWRAIYAPNDPCDTVGGNTCDSYTDCIDRDNALADALSNYTGSVWCPEHAATLWKTTWPTKSDCTAENPPNVGCVCYDIGDQDYYEWECPFGDSCT